MSENQYLNGTRKARPVTYFDLAQKVGDSGRYQLIMLLIFTIQWFVTGVLLLGTAFFFRSRSLDCSVAGLLVPQKDCKDYVCKLPQKQWRLYYSKEDNQFDSIASQQQYLCDGAATIDAVSSCVYFGAFIGYIVISFFSDNFGRRTSMVVSWGIGTLGSILVATQVHIVMVAIGFFLCGCGCDAAINICFFFFSEVVSDQKRQKYSVFVQIFFPVGALLATLFFYLIPDWRINWIILVLAPAAVQFLLLFYFIEQTPQFLLKKGIQKSLKSLNRIGKINGFGDSVLQQQDIKNVLVEQVTQQFKDQYITPVDLIRFPSLRSITIICSIIAFMNSAMYYGPALIIDDIGFSIYISNILVNISELITYVPAYLFIQKIPRKGLGIILYIIAVCCALVLSFVKKPQGSAMSFQAILELIFVFIFRGCIAFFFCFYQVFYCELYPGRARAIGAGMVSAIGTLASTSSPIYLGYLRRNNIDVNTFFVLFGIIVIGNLTLLNQTKGKQLKQQIQQIQLQKQKRRSTVSNHNSQKKQKSQISHQKTQYSQKIA